MKRDLVRATSERKGLAPAPQLDTKGEPVAMVQEVYSLALRLDGRGAYFKDSPNWSHYRVDVSPDPHIHFLQTLALMSEVTRFGSPDVETDRTRNRDLYRSLVTSQAKIMLGQGGPADHNKMKAHLRHSHYANLEFAHDVKAEMIAIQEDKNKDGNNDEDLPLEVEEARLEQENFFDFAAVKDVKLDLQSRLSSGLENFNTMVQKVVEGFKKQTRQQPAPASLDLVSSSYGTYTGPARVNKITMAVIPIPKVDNATEIAGLLVQFIVCDPHLNPGAFYDQLIENENGRSLAASNRRGRFSNFVDMLPLHNNYGDDHPAHRASREIYLQCALRICPELLQQSTEEALRRDLRLSDEYCNLHLSKVLTLDRALKTLADAGGKVSDFAREAHPQSRPFCVTFPKEVTVYKYDSIQMAWYSRDKVGLCEQYFPHITNFGIGHSSAMMEVVKKQAVLPRAILDMDKLVTYQTSNVFVHLAAAAEKEEKKVMGTFPLHYEKTLDEVQRLVTLHGERWRQHISHITDKIGECEAYIKARTEMQAKCLSSFTSLWRTEGDLDALPISDPIKAMLKWFRDKKLPTVTRAFVVHDPSMDLFGSSMLKHLLIFRSLFRILQPVVCLMSEGLFSAYDWFRGQIKLHLMYHGRFDVGKTYTAIKTLASDSTIPGTVSTTSISTAAADTTMKHAYDVINASDECPQFFVSEREAIKVPDRVNKEKLKMTANQVEQNTFALVDHPDTGESVRWAESTTTDHYSTSVIVTNHPVELKNPLASRFFCSTMPSSNTPTNEMNGPKDEALVAKGKLHLQLNQFLSAGAKKLAMVGGMLQDVELTLFDDISNKVKQFLTNEGVLTADVGGRSLEKMQPYARQLIYHMAIHHVFDLPTSPHYEKPFHPSMLQAMQPYLYSTIAITWWVWTAMASEFVDESYGNILRAARQAAQLDTVWPEKESPYQAFEKDIKNKIPWKETTDQEGTVMVDLNYITLKGSMDQICNNIAQHTKPKLGKDDVKGYLLQMAEHNMGVRYQPECRDTLKLHKYIRLPNAAEGSLGAKQAGGIYREDSLNDAPTTRKPLVDKSNIGKHELHIMPNMADHFDKNIIIKALMASTFSESFPAGKLLIAFPLEKDPTLLDVCNVTEEILRQFSSTVDNKSMEAYEGDASSDELTRPVSRMNDGIAFNRRGGFGPAEAEYFYDANVAPNPIMMETRAIIQDLDGMSAKRQHIKCGRDLGAPILTPSLLRRQFDAVRDPRRPSDYPQCLLNDFCEKNKGWKGAENHRVLAEGATAAFKNAMKKREPQAEIDELPNQTTAQRPRVAGATKPGKRKAP